VRYLVALLTIASLTHGQDRVDDIFRRWDKNADGKLAKEEFPERLRARFEAADKDKSGAISPAEHRAFLRRPTSAPLPDSVRMIVDQPYCGTDNRRQRLDLLLPKERKSDAPLPVVVFIHGGGWRNGDKARGRGRIAPLVATGSYAAASVGYRLTGEAIWPAQIHDCKAAIRWIKAHAKKHNLDPDRIGVWGTSAGGHLVAMLGVSGDVKELEGKLGSHLDRSSRVACVVDFFGPAQLEGNGSKSSPVGRLLGGPVAERAELAKQASPITHASSGDAPFLILHGTKDQLVAYKQSVLMHAALEKAGVASLLVPVEGAGHGFRGAEVDKRVRDYLALHLLRREVTVTDAPIKPEPRQRRTLR
jgi:acetyl esterase/lipase